MFDKGKNLLEQPQPSEQQFDSVLRSFREDLRCVKSETKAPKGGWYPFDSLSALSWLKELADPIYKEIWSERSKHSVLDLGCGDGDLSMWFASCGASVDAVDCQTSNFNRMLGIEILRTTLQFPVRVHNIDLDSKFDFPGTDYSLALFLGTLYHLKNPYSLLEKLVYHARWCLLSTRIAQVTPRVGARIEDEPMAYLADGHEINDDATNFWIFSATGLLRLVQRTRWAVRGIKRVGCLVDSNPIAADRDERMILLLQSRVYYPDLRVLPGKGWLSSEGEMWRWTEKRFSVQIILPLERNLISFTLPVFIPDQIIGEGIRMEANVRGSSCGILVCNGPGLLNFKGKLPVFSLHEPVLRIDFEVFSSYRGDGRDLGVCVPLLDGEIPFTVE